jgi:putative oxidoreductase
MKVFAPYRDHAYAIFRFMSGALFACHGAQKLFGALGGQKVNDPLMLVGGIIEFAGGIMIALGFFAAIAAFIACGEMAVAYFKAHAPGGFWPIENKGELAVLYCFVFLYIAAHDSGRIALDRAFRRRG